MCVLLQPQIGAAEGEWVSEYNPLKHNERVRVR